MALKKDGAYSTQASVKELSQELTNKMAELTVKMYQEVVSEIVRDALREWFLPPHRDEDYEGTQVKESEND